MRADYSLPRLSSFKRSELAPDLIGKVAPVTCPECQGRRFGKKNVVWLYGT